jgi:hypothetical protein
MVLIPFPILILRSPSNPEQLIVNEFRLWGCEQYQLLNVQPGKPLRAAIPEVYVSSATFCLIHVLGLHNCSVKQMRMSKLTKLSQKYNLKFEVIRKRPKNISMKGVHVSLAVFSFLTLRWRVIVAGAKG